MPFDETLLEPVGGFDESLLEPVESTAIRQPLPDQELLDAMLARQNQPSTVVSTTVGGPRVPVAGFRETIAEPIQVAEELSEEPTKPALPLSQIVPDIRPEEPWYTAAAKTAGKLALGVPEFFTSPMGVAAAGAGYVAPIPTAIGFGADITKGLVDAKFEAEKNWGNWTPAEKAQYIVNVLGSTSLLGGIGKGLSMKLAPTPAAEQAVATLVTPKKVESLPESARALMEQQAEKPSEIKVEDYVPEQPTEVVVNKAEFATPAPVPPKPTEPVAQATEAAGVAIKPEPPEIVQARQLVSEHEASLASEKAASARYGQLVRKKNRTGSEEQELNDLWANLERAEQEGEGISAGLADEAYREAKRLIADYEKQPAAPAAPAETGGPNAIQERSTAEVPVGEAPGNRPQVEPQVRQQAPQATQAEPGPTQGEILLSPPAPEAPITIIQAWHATDEPSLVSFSLKKSQQREVSALGEGFYASPDKGYAKSFGKNLHQVEIRLFNPASVNQAQSAMAMARQERNPNATKYTKEDAKRAREILIKQGFDGVYDPKDAMFGSDVVSFYPEKQVSSLRTKRSTEPVLVRENATVKWIDFNPWRPEIPPGVTGAKIEFRVYGQSHIESQKFTILITKNTIKGEGAWRATLFKNNKPETHIYDSSPERLLSRRAIDELVGEAQAYAEEKFGLIDEDASYKFISSKIKVETPTPAAPPAAAGGAGEAALGQNVLSPHQVTKRGDVFDINGKKLVSVGNPSSKRDSLKLLRIYKKDGAELISAAGKYIVGVPPLEPVTIPFGEGRFRYRDEFGNWSYDEPRVGGRISVTDPRTKASWDEEVSQPPTSPAPPEATAGAVPGAPLTPAPPSATPVPVVPIKAMSQVIRDLSKGLGVPIQFSRAPLQKLGGFFKPVQNLIASKRPIDVPVVSHEVGHKLDTTFKLSADPTIASELNVLGDPATPGSQSSWTVRRPRTYKMSEGMAEFVRYWLTDTAKARTSAPNTYAKWERVLDANKDFGDVMRQAQSDIATWRNSPAQARLRSKISTSNPAGTRYTLSQLTRDVIDDLHILRLAVDYAKKMGADLLPSKNPYLLARILRGSYGMADQFITKGIVDFKTKSVNMGTGLEQILKPVSSRLDDFRDWIIAKRAQELHARGKRTGIDDADEVARQFDADPVFNDTFTRLKAWNDAVLQYAIDAKLVPEGVPSTPTTPATGAHLIREMNRDYVPFHRIYEVAAGEMPSETTTGVGRGLNVGRPTSLKRLKGSERDIVDPLETMVKNAYSIITASEKNAIHVALADMANLRGMGAWIRKASPPKEAVNVPMERIRDQLEAMGVDTSAIPQDTLLTFFESGKQAPFGQNIIKVKRGDSTEFYQLKPELFDTFHALDQESAGHLTRMLGYFPQILRAGVTLSPDFAVSNIIRDTVSSSIVSRYGIFPFTHSIRGMFALLNNPKLVSEWAASGGKQSIEVNYFDRDKMQEYIRKKVSGMTPTEKAAFWVKSPLAALRWFTGTFEEATRIGEYKRVLDANLKRGMDIGEARRLAAFESRDYQDFSKGGAKTKSLRLLAAFWNAQTQGTVKLGQAFKEKPIATTLKGLAFVTTAKMLEQYSNWDDPDYWDRPQWERDLFFLFKYGEDSNGRSKFIRVPTPFEVGVIFGTIPGRITQWIKENRPEVMTSFVKDFLRIGIPNPTPQVALTALETAAGPQGYSFWRGRPIVSERYLDQPPEERFSEQTSLTARKLGQALKSTGISPLKIDYFLQQTIGGLGRIAIHQGIDRAISAMTGEQRTAKGVVPFGRFFTTPAGIQSEAVERFYTKLSALRIEKTRQQKAAETYVPKEKLQIGQLKAMENAARQMSKLRGQIREITDEEQKQAIYIDIANIAKQFID